MIKNIFLILCGEDEIKRPRSRHLLFMLKRQNQYKIIISWFSSFIVHPDSSESSRIAHYLIKHGILRSNILLEEQSMDTLGNIIFSHAITELLLKQYHHISTITLITETFHLYRSQRLFSCIFDRLLKRYNLQSYFMGSENQELEDLYRKQEKNIIISSFYNGTLSKKDIRQFIYDINQRRKRKIKEIIILEILLIDFKIFQLHSFKQFQNYLYNLPIYNTVYHKKKLINISMSLYSKAINYVMNLS